MATFLQHGYDLRDSERGLKNKFNWSWMERSVAGTDAEGAEILMPVSTCIKLKTVSY